MVATPTARRPALRITDAKVETALCFHAIEVIVHQPRKGASPDCQPEWRRIQGFQTRSAMGVHCPDEGRDFIRIVAVGRIAAAATSRVYRPRPMLKNIAPDPIFISPKGSHRLCGSRSSDWSLTLPLAPHRGMKERSEYILEGRTYDLLRKSVLGTLHAFSENANWRYTISA